VPDFREVKRGTYCYSEINLCFLILSCLIVESSVERGIPSFRCRTFWAGNLNEADGYVVEAKRNAPRDDGNVKANTVFAFAEWPLAQLCFPESADPGSREPQRAFLGHY